MGFWQNVDNELKYQCMERKVLAAEVGFDVSYIGKGIRRNSIPSADLALKIAKTLNVSIEYLLGFPEESSNSENTNIREIQLYRKYFELITELEKMTLDERLVIENLLKIMNKNKDK